MGTETGCQIVYCGPNDLQIESQVRPILDAGEILIEVEAVAICGSDMKTWANGNPRVKPPHTMGHEFCGTIIEVAADVKTWKPGQRVTMATSIGCGECFYCKRGMTNICNNIKPMGFYFPGAMARWIKIPALAVNGNYLVDVGNLDAELGALSEPLSCTINNLSQIPIECIESAAVIGLGPLGILHAITLRQMGVKTIVGSQSADKRSELAAKAFDFDALVTPDELPAQSKKHSDGEGFDLVVVTAPNAAVQANAVNYVRKGGYVSLFASLPAGKEMVEFNTRTIHYGELKVCGCSDSTSAHVAKAIEMLTANPDKYRSIISSRFPLEKINLAVERVSAREEMKVVLIPGELR